MKEHNLANDGFVILKNAVPDMLVGRINEALEKSYHAARKIQLKNDPEALTDGTLHHLLAHPEPVFLEIIDFICHSELYAVIREYFGGNFILNSYGGCLNFPSKPTYAAKVHRDIRFYSGDFPLMLNMIIMLDDFTEQNGATHLLTGSHKIKEKPTDEEFYQKAERGTGKRGDVIFFNSNLWHASGANLSDKYRRTITITFTKPFMKQQLDYSRAVGYENLKEMNAELKQVIGYFSRTPSSLEEFYQKPADRFYQPNQD